MAKKVTDQRIYRGEPDGDGPSHRLKNLPKPPPWRAFARDGERKRAEAYRPDPSLIKIVNAALILRRPILLEGDPGSGKTTLAYAVAEELGLPGPFCWSITSRTALSDGLYQYDALARLHDSQMKKTAALSEQVGRYIRLGPVGMAFAVTKPNRPAVLLIDEIDKSDIDLPSDLLHLFEEGRFPIPELERMESEEPIDVLPGRSSKQETGAVPEKIPVTNGQVICDGEFPLVIMTSNQGREFPAPFLRRCLRRRAQPLDGKAELLDMARKHLEGYLHDIEKPNEALERLVERYLERRQRQVQSFDQLLNAIVLYWQQTGDLDVTQDSELIEAVWTSLGTKHGA